MTNDVLSRRELNRATLHRQLLLDRHELPVPDAVGRLFGLNAQAPEIPYLALWARLRGFRVDDLTAAVEDGRVVRSTMMRATQHMVSVADFELVRPVLTPLLRRVQRSTFGRRIGGVDLDELADEARELLAARVLTRPELGRLLARSRPDAEPTALGWTVQYLEPVVHPAPSGTWGVNGRTPFALGSERARRPATLADAQQLVRRYLAAFGPASVADIRAWSGVAGLPEVVDTMRGELRPFTGESGRELVDLPDAPRPPGDTPAAVRLLPGFDAPILGYADRTRLMTGEVRGQVCVGDAVAATVLVDGEVAATWTVEGNGDAAHVAVHPLRRLAEQERAEVDAEAAALDDFLRTASGGQMPRISTSSPTVAPRA